jgi:opacity protein-like surface antigen
MKKQNRILAAAVLAAVSSSAVTAAKPVNNYSRTPWDGFYVGGMLGGKVLGGKGTITTIVDEKKSQNTQDDVLFPLPAQTLTFGFNKEVGGNSTVGAGCELEYGILPTIKFSYGYLATPLDRISLGLGFNALLMGAAISPPTGLEINSLFGFTPSISYERALGLGAFFQVQVTYNYLNVKGANLGEEYKFHTSVKRFIKDYWDTDVKGITDVDATAHGVTLSAGFGYTF